MATPTRICSPSVTGRARLRVVRSTPGSAPPAIARTSATREPGFARTRPGRRTLPATWTTTTVAAPVGVADGEAPDRAETGVPGIRPAEGCGSGTTCGRARSTEQPAHARPTARTRATTTT